MAGGTNEDNEDDKEHLILARRSDEITKVS